MIEWERHRWDLVEAQLCLGQTANGVWAGAPVGSGTAPKRGSGDGTPWKISTVYPWTSLYSLYAGHSIHTDFCLPLYVLRSEFSHFCTLSIWSFHCSDRRFIAINWCGTHGSWISILFWPLVRSMSETVWDLKAMRYASWRWRKVDKCQCQEGSKSYLTYISAILKIPLSGFHYFLNFITRMSSYYIPFTLLHSFF